MTRWRICLGYPTGAQCGRVTRGSRCPEHERAWQRARDQRRGSPAQRGYDATYNRNRRKILATPQRCHWCGAPAATVDHLVPLAHGGSNELDNLVPCCKRCNYSRGSNPEWRPPR